jgi:hypothetical protein
MKEEDFFETVTADASAFEGLTVGAGSKISDLVRQHVELTKELKFMEEQVGQLKNQLGQIEREYLPDKMQEIGMDRVEVNGNELKLDTFVSARLPTDPMQRQQAFQHLRELGCGDYIKNTVSASFPMTQDNRAKALADDLNNQGFTTEVKTWVENPTLRKLVKEEVEKGSGIDLDLLNGFTGFIVKIKGGKK